MTNTSFVTCVFKLWILQSPLPLALPWHCLGMRARFECQADRRPQKTMGYCLLDGSVGGLDQMELLVRW